MKTVAKFLLLVAILSTISLMMKCTVSRLTGTGSSSEVTGMLFEPDGKKPARGASVVMRSFDYLPEIQHLGNYGADNGFFVCSTSTDHKGEYSFTSRDSIREGMYCIEGRDGNNNCVLIDSVMIVIDSNYSLSDTLKPPATIQGIVPLNDDSTKVYVRVYGLDKCAKVDSNNTFSLKNLPAGNLRLHISISRDSIQSYDTEKVPTTAGDTSVIFKVTFDSRGGSLVAPQMVNDGGYVSEPTPPINTSCDFAGWFKEPACLNAWSFASETVATPVTLYAKWIVRDVDGNIYATVTIGNQVWLVENLKTTRYNDSAIIPPVMDSNAWSNLRTPGYCWYENDETAYKSAYGALYNWYTVNTGKLAPSGWHVPTDAEWDTLQNYLIVHGYNWDETTTGNMIGKSLAAKSHWTISIIEGAIGNDLTHNNKSGFSALPGGFRFVDGKFYDMNNYCKWWSSTESAATSGTTALTRSMFCDETGFYYGSSTQGYGLSVRCVRDK